MFDLPLLLRYNETRFLRILTDSLNKEKSPMEQKPNVLPLRLEDVSYQYEPDARPAVSHVTLEVERGSFVAVLLFFVSFFVLFFVFFFVFFFI